MGNRMSGRGRRLSDEAVVLMRKMYFEFSYPYKQRELAKKFNTTQGYVSAILSGKRRTKKGGR